MYVFVTGGTGYFGSALVEHLLAAGHTVTGLARSDQAASSLASMGADVLRASLDDVEALEEAADRADATIHTAVDYTMSEGANARELAAIRALVRGAGRAGTGKPLVFTSTTLVYGFDPTQATDEDAELPELSAQPVKVAAERIVRTAEGVTGMVFRAGLIHGRGGSGLLTGLIRSAATQGAAIYIGEGANAWTPVHIDDLADLYVRAIERPAPGVYNAVGADPFTFRELAEAIGELTGTAATPITSDTAQQQLGPLAMVISTTSTPRAERARSTFGWDPRRTSLLEDVRAGSYAL